MIATDRKDSNFMARSKSIVVLIALGAAVSGCNGGGQLVKSAANRSLDSVNQPVVERTDYAIDLAAGDAGLPDAERTRLRGWFESLALGYGDRVWVDGARDGASRNDIARVAAEYGLLLSDGAPVTPGEVQPGSIRVIVTRSMASVPGCPNWEPHFTSATAANYGCAVNSNLAAMVADPSDLVLGQSDSGSGRATTASRAIKVYRETAPSGTRGLDTTSSKGGN
jgi:pilus assembly protein CpaD